jgi:hypothetical protein
MAFSLDCDLLSSTSESKFESAIAGRYGFEIIKYSMERFGRNSVVTALLLDLGSDVWLTPRGGAPVGTTSRIARRKSLIFFAGLSSY